MGSVLFHFLSTCGKNEGLQMVKKVKKNVGLFLLLKMKVKVYSKETTCM